MPTSRRNRPTPLTAAIRQAADSAPADAVTRADLEPLATSAELESLATRADLAALEARLTWRFAGAMLAQTGVVLAAVIGAAVAIIRALLAAS